MVLWGEIEAPEVIMIVQVEGKEAWAKANRIEGQSRETDGCRAPSSLGSNREAGGGDGMRVWFGGTGRETLEEQVRGSVEGPGGHVGRHPGFRTEAWA